MSQESPIVAAGRFRPMGSTVQRASSLVCVLFLLSIPVSADEPNGTTQAQPQTLTWAVESSHVTLSPQDRQVFLRFRVQAADVPSAPRQPLTLALVFDRSGSMDSEDKIGYLRKAGHLVADNLTYDDYLAMIAFNQEVQTLVPLHQVVNREYLHHRIDELYAEGYTNLSGGLLEGCAEVEKRLKEPGFHHVIVLTDGVANRGVWQPDALVRLVERATSNGITVTTIGVGTEYNESLLSRMAQSGGGRYIYVAEPDEMPNAFQQELGALLAVVAQNVKLQMPLPNGVEVRRVFGREQPQKPGRLELPLGDVTSGEERVIVAELGVTPTAGGVGEAPLEFKATLTYDDVREAQRKESQQSVVMQRTDQTRQITPVLAYAKLVEAVDKIALAVASMDRNVAAEVLQIERNEFPALKKAAWDSHDQTFVNKAFMFEHYARELKELIDEGALHEHSQERARLQKELHYRRYLMEHHRHDHQH